MSKWTTLRFTQAEKAILVSSLEEKEKDLLSDLQEYDSRSTEAEEILAEALAVKNLIDKIQERE